MSDEKKVAKRRNNVITRQEENSFKRHNSSEFNRCSVNGRIEAEFEYSYKTFGEKFYQTRVIVKRLSGTEDFIPIVVSELLIEREKMQSSLKGKWVELEGQFRGTNKLGADLQKHKELYLFVMEIYIHEDELEESASKNEIYLDGYINKPPVFKKTAVSKREITYLMIAVNRSRGKSDYIPCLAWGKYARMVSKCEIGTRVQLYGRIQSRIYPIKNSSDSDASEYRQVYEISVSKIQKVEDSESEE